MRRALSSCVRLSCPKRRWAPILVLGVATGCSDSQLMPFYPEPKVSILSPSSGDHLPAGDTAVFVAAVDAHESLSQLDYLWFLNGDPTQVVGTRADTVIGADGQVTLTLGAGLEVDATQLSLRVEDSRQQQATDILSPLTVTPNEAPRVTVLAPTDADVWVLSDVEETVRVDVLVEIEDLHERSEDGLTLRWTLDGVVLDGPVHPVKEDGRFVARTTLAGLGLQGDAFQRVGRLAVEAVDSQGLTGADSQGLHLTVCDVDGDGYAALEHAAYCEEAWDCDDGNGSIHPGSVEVCDGLDTDCDGRLPEDEQDLDGDGVMLCEGDCLEDPLHPLSASVFPGDHPEVCNNGVDDNCNDSLEQCVWASDDEIQAHLRTVSTRGGAVASLATGDVRLDGLGVDAFSDLLLGVPADGNEPGAAYLLLGSSELVVDETNTSWGSRSLESTAAVRFRGPAEGESIGTAVAMGDLNADGYTDVVLGAGAAAGAVYVLYGPFVDGEEVLVTGQGPSQQVFVGDKPANYVGEHLGSALAVGDVTGDGIDDLVAGAPYNRSRGIKQAGAVYVWAGSAHGLDAEGGPVASIYGTGQVLSADGTVARTRLSVRLGATLRLADVIDGDAGRKELVVGAPAAHVEAADGAERVDAGAVLVYSVGSDDLDLDEDNAACIILGDDSHTALGSALATADVQGDGRDDLLIGAPGRSDGDGGAFLVGGAQCTIGLRETADQLAEAAWQGELQSSAGASVALSDLDGDGELDAFLGGPAWEDAASYTDVGATWLTYGPLDATVVLAEDRDALWFGDERRAELGRVMLGAGDLNNDGLGDVAIGAPGVNAGGGGAYLLMGLGY